MPAVPRLKPVGTVPSDIGGVATSPSFDRIQGKSVAPGLGKLVLATFPVSVARACATPVSPMLSVPAALDAAESVAQDVRKLGRLDGGGVRCRISGGSQWLADADLRAFADSRRDDAEVTVRIPVDLSA